MRVMLIGANGQLGSDLVKVLGDRDLILLTHAEIEVTEGEQVQAALAQHRPEVVINTAAFHQVDLCEKEVERSFRVNAFGTRLLALACRDHNAVLVQISTDYVFGGDTGRTKPYAELDCPAPLNVYGLSKLAGEHFIRYLWPKHFVVRTSGLYGLAGSSGKGGNFVEGRLKQAREGRTIRMVADQVLTPTYTVDLAGAIGRLIETEHYGLYHITSAGECSWYEFTAKILELSGLYTDLTPQTTDASGATARRPAYSVLENVALRAIGLDEMRPWEEALADYLEARQRSQAGEVPT
jgi:dTDP-4-dehydrorhamnose reductase